MIVIENEKITIIDSNEKELIRTIVSLIKILKECGKG